MKPIEWDRKKVFKVNKKISYENWNSVLKGFLQNLLMYGMVEDSHSCINFFSYSKVGWMVHLITYHTKESINLSNIIFKNIKQFENIPLNIKSKVIYNFSSAANQYWKFMTLWKFFCLFLIWTKKCLKFTLCFD